MTSRNRTSISDTSDLYRAVSRMSARSIESLRAARAGSSGSSSVRTVHDADADLALRLAAEEARQLEAFENDRTIAVRLARSEGNHRVPFPESYPWRIITPNETLAFLPRPIPGPLVMEFDEQAPAMASADGDHSPRMPGAYELPPQPPSSHQRQADDEEADRQLRSGLTSLTLMGALSAIANAVRLVWNYSISQPVTGSIVRYRGATPEQSPVISETETAQERERPPEATAFPTAPVLKSRKQHHDCVSCMERIRGAEVLAPCGHHCDVPCVLELFAAATRDESLFPPRCCRQNIPLTMIQPFMAASALKTYREKAAEFGTPKRVYCARPACSRFLGAQFEATPSRAAPALQCPAVGCSTKTCSGCKNEVKSSTSHSCVATDADATVLELAETSGWARCPGCRTLIELNQGCYHMTCRCKAQFCYLCQAPWKTCACPQWDEERLFHAAQARADGHPGLVFRREPWDRNPGGLVQALMQQLREHHECTHERSLGNFIAEQAKAMRTWRSIHLISSYACNVEQCEDGNVTIILTS
ncbi:hypothetical protein VTO73DRAFT_6712 [Trametes versicolor]